MLYIKTRLNDDTVIMTEITPDNVYARCDVCGREMHVDLYDLIADEDDGDTEDPDCLCCRCTRRPGAELLLHPELFMED